MRAMSTPYMVAAAHPSLGAEQLDRFVAAIRHESRFFGPRALHDGPKPTPALVGRLLADDGTTFVAMVDREVIGMARLTDDLPGGELWIAVVQQWRGRGVGADLARTVIDHGQRTGYQRIVLHSSHRSRAARALGESLGFHVVDMGRGRVDLVADLAQHGVPA